MLEKCRKNVEKAVVRMFDCKVVISVYKLTAIFLFFFFTVFFLKSNLVIFNEKILFSGRPPLLPVLRGLRRQQRDPAFLHQLRLHLVDFHIY